VILVQSAITLIAWAIIFIFCMSRFQVPIPFFSIGLCFILPLHAFRVSNAMRQN